MAFLAKQINPADAERYGLVIFLASIVFKQIIVPDIVFFF